MEGSKVFCKEILKKYNIPMGSYEVFINRGEAEKYIASVSMPIVIKADGLAAGKGVFVCQERIEAQSALKQIMEDKAFGDSGNLVVVEECLIGEEASMLAFVDGETVVPMPSSQDHKAIYDGDKGPNTGGMGAYSPAPVVDAKMSRWIETEVFQKTVSALRKEGIVYKGVLYAGLMVTDNGPKVLEFNVRFGDPETQPLLMRLDSDLLEICQSVVDGTLSGQSVSWKDETTVCVVVASGGYPGSYEKGRVISGLEKADKMEGIKVFHSGTAKKEGNVVTSGGRVLGVTALGKDVKEAIDRAYAAVDKISFDKMYYRKDIGKKALKRV